ncbi:MAG: ATP-dependent Clp protease ATP-binding subunit [Candidatus Obscuribacter sp.]|nr:ATP-dependent Clp protease ATP-binding subunit [Candidatus Obscuribacter sp.]MBK9277657.1 ATP-dependent Clp protease ATP-binding subunit [Candidatus Obscuribacter sp.]
MSAQIATSVSGRRRRLNPKVLPDAVIGFKEHLDANLFGQQEGKDLLTFAFTAAHNPLRNRNKPIAFIINAGKSRTGKTHSVELLAERIHGNPKAYLRIDMAEYMDKYSISNLKGSGRGYINNQSARDEGYNAVAKDVKHDYAEFTNHNLEWSKRGSTVPVSIVLLDELDKACAEVFLLLLGIMDHGKLTLGNGEVVDFTNTIFVCACNLGMAEVEREETGGIGFNAQTKKLSKAEVRTTVLDALKHKAPPEFRNRVNELGGVAIYEELTRAQMEQVVVREIGEMQKRITATGYHFVVSASEACRKEILDRALANNGNLANVKSVLSKEVETALGLETMKKSVKMGDYVEIDVETVAVDGVDKVEFVFYIEDMSARLLGAPAPADLGSLPKGEAANGDGEESPLPEVDPSVFNIAGGRLLGTRPGVVVLMQRPMQRPTGELVVDQLYSLGMLPDVSALFTDLHNMTMVERMMEAKFKAERFPELRHEFTLELVNEKHYQALGEQAQQLVQELVRFMGVEVVDSHMTHVAPFKFTIRVRALDDSMALARLRFPKLSIKRSED